MLTGLDRMIGEERLLYGAEIGLFWRAIGSLVQMVHAFDTQRRHRFARHATQAILAAYWEANQRMYSAFLPFRSFDEEAASEQMDDIQQMLLRGLGRLAAQQEPLLAGYCIGEVYTRLLPDEIRAKFGVYYTPPALTRRLLSMASAAGVDWRNVRALDPACGGGAFLAPVALEMRKALAGQSPFYILRHIEGHLVGYEIDSFAAWVSQTLLEASLYDLCVAAQYRIQSAVVTRDALNNADELSQFDLVIGNPPYGRVNLDPSMRKRYRRSVYGHANLYGLFMDLAVRLTKPGGLIALITPTSFLGGQYFRELRSLMIAEAPPVSIDFVSARKGVFTDVLQETVLGVYRRGSTTTPASVHVVSLLTESDIEVTSTGAFNGPRETLAPWLIPRNANQVRLIERLRAMPHRLRDYGYRVSTGPLVWNRHKPQLTDQKGLDVYPIIWAESITRDGRFVHRTDKRNHKRYIRIGEGDDWLLERQTCVLVQRTTAKEQQRRLIAAELPSQFLAEHRAVSIENHVNMVRPITQYPKASLSLLVALFNSEIVDSAFRCISGSVAVSATELESLPLPPPDGLVALEQLIDAGISKAEIESAIAHLYFEDVCYAA